MSYHIPDPHSVDYREVDAQDLKFTATPVSWYTTRNALRGEAGFCGQDESALLFLHLPKRLSNVNFNLNRTHPDDDFKMSRYSDDENISDLLSWIQEMGHLNADSTSSAEFLCLRHELVELLLMPYANERFNRAIKMHMTKLDGKIYIRRIACDFDQKMVATSISNDFENLRTRQGLIMQHYLLSDSPSRAPVANKPYVRGEKNTYMVFEGSIGKHKLLYSNKVKALDKPDDLMNLDTATFTDIRTNMGYSSMSIKWHKWLTYWGNCIIGRINKVVVGFVKDAHVGVVKNVEIIPASIIIPKCQQAFKKDRFKPSENAPSGEICLDTLDKILNFIKVELKNAKMNEVYEFEFNPEKSRVATLQRISSSTNENYFVLPDWYTKWVNSVN